MQGPGFTCPVAPFYQAVPPGKPVAVPGSTGFLEIAINGGNAARKLALKTKSEIRVVF
jgi:S-adenosylmethionine hydrolase